MLLLIDNFDSFTFNLAQLIRQAGAEVTVVRNDQISLQEIEQMDPSQIVFSPGPGSPSNSGLCLAVAVACLTGELCVPLLGVCLGHQVIAQVAGAPIRFAKEVRHGKTSSVAHEGLGMFVGLPSPLTVVRYHSLSVEAAPLDFVVTARAVDDGEIMGLKHVSLPIESVQFHPESILTEGGLSMITQFLMAQ
ncbi:MAG: aminodeoxychorismate/anthranilate synthase component II [Chthonomonas sp.]|nr:aminodeoxychorismate/anthranilate synthase component II [Chthonomonas sp.]